MNRPKHFSCCNIKSCFGILHSCSDCFCFCFCRINPIAVCPDLLCSAGSCWNCKRYCHCCSFYMDHDAEFCCEACQVMYRLDPTATPTVLLNEAELTQIFESHVDFQATPVIAFMKKAFSTPASEFENNSILRIYLCRSDENIQVIPAGKIFAVCQIRYSSSSQVVIDCLLSDDYVPLEPVWYSDFCERMIEKHRAFLHSEIKHLVTHTLGTASNN